MRHDITMAGSRRVERGVGLTVRLDVSDTYGSLCVIDGDGCVVEEGRVRTTTPALTRRFCVAPCRIVTAADELVIDKPTALYTHLHVREDALTLCTPTARADVGSGARSRK